MEEALYKKFASDYDTIFLVDLDTNEMEISHSKPNLEVIFNELSKNGYDQYQQKFSSKYIFPEDREWIIKTTNPESVREALKDEGVLLINYRLKTSDDKTLHYQTKITKYEDASGTDKVIIGGHSVDKAETENLKRIKAVTTAHHDAVIASLSTDFDYICYINLENRHVHCFYASEVFKRIINKLDTSLHTYDRLLALFDTVVYKDDIEQFKKDIQDEKILEQLELLPSYELFFRVVLENQLFYYKLRIVKDKNNPNGIILGLLSFDEQIRTKIQHREQQQAHALMEKQMELLLAERTAEIQEKNKVLNRINEDIIELLGDVTEARDIESGEHIHRVKGFTRILANQVMLDWPEYVLTPEKIELISSASPLHDIGKIAIPDAILLKPGKLTEEEFEIMKTHTTKGCELLKKSPKDWSPAYLETSIEICHFHHEKYDGKGYPLGLKGDEIPISAQIVSLADCYDALTSKRVYKDAFSTDTAYAMIMEGKCGLFNPKLLDSFRKCISLFEKQDFDNTAIDYGDSIDIRENLAGKLILYAEDEEISRTIGREMLEGEGAVVIEARTGKEALNLFESASEGAFDAILLDIYMPDTSGYEVARIIRGKESEYARKVPIVAFTASDKNENVKKCLEAGMNAHVSKPVSVSNLSSVLLRLINNRSGI